MKKEPFENPDALEPGEVESTVLEDFDEVSPEDMNFPVPDEY